MPPNTAHILQRIQTTCFATDCAVAGTGHYSWQCDRKTTSKANVTVKVKARNRALSPQPSTRWVGLQEPWGQRHHLMDSKCPKHISILLCTVQCVLTSGTVLKACPQRMQGLGINTGGELIAKLANSCSSGKTAVRTVCVVVYVCVCHVPTSIVDINCNVCLMPNI